MESRKDELEIAIKDLDETYEQEMDSHQDIRLYVEEKVIKKEDAVDFMIDREEVTLLFLLLNHLLWVGHLTVTRSLSSINFRWFLMIFNDFKISLGILENIKRAENCISFDFKMILVIHVFYQNL